MKKLCSIIALMTLCLMCSSHLYAFGEEPLEHINYLDLSNLEYHESGWYAYTKQPIVLKPNTEFTLVLSKGFLGQHWDYLGYDEIMIGESNGSAYYSDFLYQDDIHERAYLSFTTTDGVIDISLILVQSTQNYEAMLYEGNYSDFPGYIPYVHRDEKLAYYGYLPINYDEQLSLETIKSYVIAKNPMGSIIPSTLVFDDYSLSLKKPGQYQMVFQTQYNSIAKKFFLNLKVFDITKPVLSIEEPLRVPLNEKWTLDQIKNQITITDNVDSLGIEDLMVIEDAYSDANTIGNYPITFEVADHSGNKNLLQVMVELYDMKGPNIKGPKDVYIYTTDTPLTDAQIQQKLLITDDVDGQMVSVIIHQNEYKQTTIPGRYMMEFHAKDSAFNLTKFYMYIHVIDNRGPVFEHSEYIMDKTTAELMTESEIMDWLKDQLRLAGHHATAMRVLYNEYEDHQNLAGSYYVYLAYQVNDEEVTSRIRIDVQKKNSSPVVLILSVIGIVFVGSAVLIYCKHKKN